MTTFDDVLVWLLIVVVLGALIAGVVYIRDGWRRAGHDREPLDQLFSGAASVVYKAPDATGGTDLDVLVAAATRHGYRLVTETGRRRQRRVVFERQT